MKQIIIYPGKFQPFSKHHFAVYTHLKKQFPKGDVYIVTSDKTTVDTPFSFSDKKSIAKKYGIPSENIVFERNPYSPEFIKNFDLSDTILICAYSDKDMGRLSTVKKDGSPGYYQYLTANMEYTSDQHGYIYIVPKISILHNGNELSGTYVRNMLKYCDEKSFAELFGWFDADLYNLMKDRVRASSLDEIIIGNASKKLINNIIGEILQATDSDINVDRNDMPQIDNVNLLTKWLDVNDIKFTFKELPINRIRLTQSHFDSDKVQNIIIGNDNPLQDALIVSKTYDLIDGHHRLLAGKRLHILNALCLVINLPTIELISKLKEYQFTKYKSN